MWSSVFTRPLEAREQSQAKVAIRGVISSSRVLEYLQRVFKSKPSDVYEHITTFVVQNKSQRITKGLTICHRGEANLFSADPPITTESVRSTL